MNIIWIIPISLVAGWLVNVAADTIPERRSFFATWSWSFQQIRAALTGQTSTGVDTATAHASTDRTSIDRASTIRYVTVWLLAVALGCLSVWRFSSPLAALILSIYAWFLLGIGVIDVEHRLVLNRMLLPALPAVLIGNLVLGLPSIWGSVAGGLLGFGIFLLIALIKPGSMGMGDVKLAGVIGLATGAPGILITILICIFSGGLAAFFILLRSRFQRGQTMAYAPYLVLGAWASLYFGADLWRIYMQS